MGHRGLGLLEAISMYALEILSESCGVDRGFLMGKFAARLAVRV
jgi:hypothetical protein